MQLVMDRAWCVIPAEQEQQNRPHRTQQSDDGVDKKPSHERRADDHSPEEQLLPPGPPVVGGDASGLQHVQHVVAEDLLTNSAPEDTQQEEDGQYRLWTSVECVDPHGDDHKRESDDHVVQTSEHAVDFTVRSHVAVHLDLQLATSNLAKLGKKSM